MPERLQRLEATFEHTPIYFVTACTYRRQRILHAVEVHECFLEFGKSGGEYRAWIGAYVIMPDHLHVFVAVDDSRLTLSNWVKSLKNSLSKVLRSLNVPSPHWQKGFFDHVLRSGDSYSEK